MTPPINIDGTNENYSNVTIDGQDVTQITIDGQDVLSAIPDSVANNLLVRYKFEDTGSPSKAVDDSGNNNDGVVNSGSYVTADPLIGDDSFDLGSIDTTIVWGGSSMTQMIAFRTDSLTGTRLIDNESGRCNLAYEKEATNGYEFSMFNGSNFVTIASGDSRTGTIIFAAIKYDSGSNVMEFLLGDSNTQMTSQGTDKVSTPETIGSSTNLGSNDPLDCDVDEFFWTDTALSNTDIETVRDSLL